MYICVYVLYVYICTPTQHKHPHATKNFNNKNTGAEHHPAGHGRAGGARLAPPHQDRRTPGRRAPAAG